MIGQLYPTERRILERLKDGKSHRKQDLQQLLNDELSSNGIPNNIWRLRKVLIPLGFTISFEGGNRYQAYRLVKLLNTETDFDTIRTILK